MPKRQTRAEIATRLHALEHLLAGLVRKYGEDGKRVSLEAETYEGEHTIILLTGTLPESIVIELHACAACRPGEDYRHGP